MSTSKNGLDAFERSLRESLDQFEVPYNSADWTQMERSLNGNARGWWAGGTGITVLLAGLLAMGGGLWYASSERIIEKPVAAANTVPAQAETTLQVTPEGTNGKVAPATSGSEKAVEEGSAASGMTVAENQDSAPVSTQKTASAEPGSTDPKSAKAVAALVPETTRPTSTEESGVTFRSSVSEGCPGTAVEFKVSNMPENGIYLWNFGDGSFSNQANPGHTFTKPGSYQVMLSMSAAGVGTIQNKPSSDVIVIHEAPKASFNVLKQEYDGHLPSVHFENRSMAATAYTWDFGDGQSSAIAHPDHIYKKKGVYQVELTVTNETGCVDKVMKDVRIEKDYNLEAPASFSPNGDDFQESFMPEALRTLGVKFNLTVYASNGTLLYQTNDATKPWTGRPQNRGELCGPGEYVWVVDVRESLHLAETYTGKVKLDR